MHVPLLVRIAFFLVADGALEIVQTRGNVEFSDFSQPPPAAVRVEVLREVPVHPSNVHDEPTQLGLQSRLVQVKQVLVHLELPQAPPDRARERASVGRGAEVRTDAAHQDRQAEEEEAQPAPPGQTWP